MSEALETPETLEPSLESVDGQNGPNTSGKLGVKEKLLMGTGGLPVFLGNNSVNALAMPFYNMILGVPTGIMGLAVMIPRIWDAITDPVMGSISDNYRSKYGRRRPFILLGAILMALTFTSIWMVPADWSHNAKAAWFVVTNLLFYTSFTIFSVPYVSMTYEMSPDYDERTAIQGFVTFWFKTGELLYQSVIPLATMLVTYKFATDKQQGITFVTALYGGLGMGVMGSLPAIFGRERYYELNVKEMDKKKDKDSFWKTITIALKNKAFVLLCSFTILTMFAGMFASTVDYYLLVYYMCEGNLADGASWKLVVTIGYAIMGFAGIPIIVILCKKATKLRALQFVYCLMILNAVLRWFIYQPGNQWLIWLDPLTGGLFWIGVATVMQAMIADVCDDDELNSGSRREGMFSALFQWATKLSIALSFACAGFVLQFVGFDQALGAEQAAETFQSMRLSMCLGAGIPALICLIMMMYYPLTKAKSEENRKKLEERRGSV